MARELTESNGEVSFTEQVTDSDGNNPFIESVELSQVDGSPAGNPNPSWLSWTSNKTILADGTTQRDVDVTLQTSGISIGNTYTFSFIASDGKLTSTHEVTLNVTEDKSYNLTKLSYSGNSFDISSQETNSSGVAWNDDGTKLFILGRGNKAIFEYNLSSPYDITTMSYSGNSKSVSSQDTSPSALAWNNNGTKAFVYGGFNDYVYEYGASTAYDINSLSYSGDKLDFSQDGNMNDMDFSDDGTKLLGAGWDDNLIYIYDLSLPFSISNASYTGNTFDPSNESSEGTGIVAWNNDGTKIFVGNYFEMIYEYNLSTPYDATTASYSGNSFDVGSEDSIMEDIEWNNNGSKFLMLGDANEKVYEYTIS